MFEFAASDLQKCVKDVFVSVSYKDVGLTRKQYIACENIDFCAALQWTTFNVVEVHKYGFADLDDYRLANVRCHIYNMIKAGADRKETLETVFAAYGIKNASGSLENALKDVSIDTLFRIGWMFWSIPLGTFEEKIIKKDLVKILYQTRLVYLVLFHAFTIME